MRQFVPMSDEVLYQPETFPGPLVPYRCGLLCWHQLQTEPVAGQAMDVSATSVAATGGSVSASA